MSSTEIKSLKLDCGENIPTLEDLLPIIEKHPDKLFNFELKIDNVYGSLMESLGDRRLDNIVLTSFNFPDLKKIREAGTEFPLGVIYEASNTIACPMYNWTDNIEALFTPFSLEHIKTDIIRAINPEYFSLNEYDFRPEILKEIRNLFPKTKIMIWWWFDEPLPEENSRLMHSLRHIHREGLLDMVEAIISDYPNDLVRVLEKEFGVQK